MLNSAYAINMSETRYSHTFLSLALEGGEWPLPLDRTNEFQELFGNICYHYLAVAGIRITHFIRHNNCSCDAY
jgi:hypothetical protein